MVSKANLHYTILRTIIDHGFAPDVNSLSIQLHVSEEKIISGLRQLQEYHGVVLHPHNYKIWVIHPFSLAPTTFYVESSAGQWWGNCAWCSLGIAALIEGDIKITTTIGAEKKQIEINIIDNIIQDKDYVIHFPIPMSRAWDNVIYTCSNMLIFENKQQVFDWSKQHDMPVGDIQPIEKIWHFSQKWYGNHLNPNWEKWTVSEAKALFQEFGLDHQIWKLDDSAERF